MLVWGGDVLYLTHWMRQSGLAELLPRLDKTVYVGMSAGSIAVTPYNCDAAWDLQFMPDGSDMGGGRGAGAGAGGLHTLSASRQSRHAGHDIGEHRQVGCQHSSANLRIGRSIGH